jgi:NAD(P)-dependent dehydrogenase (short-subunit alcohol dehydrogenase family)
MRSVVITGTSIGIGWATTKVLVEHGFRVFGSLRKAADAKRLSNEFGDRFIPLTFDVTDEAAVMNAAADVRAMLAGRRLTGLVNNAGIAVAGPLLELPIEEFRHQINVNLTGALISSKAFIPLIGTDPQLKGKPGRVVNISSTNGRNAIPFLAPYAASKFALEGLSESLRRELLPFDIDVILIEPRAVATPIWSKAEQIDIHTFPQYAVRAGTSEAALLYSLCKQARPAARENRRGCASRIDRSKTQGALYDFTTAFPRLDGARSAKAHRRSHDW